MNEHKITASEQVGASTYEAVWDINTGGLRIARDGNVILDKPFSEAHVAVHKAVGIGPYVTAAPSEEQLLVVVRFYAGK